MMASRRATTRGFSLVEMMVVLVIIGIVLAVAIPSFSSSNRRRRVESAANALSSRIQIARHRAVATRVPHRLVLVPSSFLYRTEWLEHDSTWVRFPDEDYSLPSGVDWSIVAGENPSNYDVEFESRGTVLSEDAPLQVVFTNAIGDTFSLSLVRTGRVVVRPGAL